MVEATFSSKLFSAPGKRQGGGKGEREGGGEDVGVTNCIFVYTKK